MTFSKSLLYLLICGGVSYASSLAVYQDKTFYTYTPEKKYIGVTQGVQAKCKDSTVSLVESLICPPQERLCQILATLENTQEGLLSLDANAKVLEKLISLPRPISFDSKSWIESAKMIGKEQASIFKEKQKVGKDLKHQQKNFQKQAPSKQALQSTQLCKKDLELSIPYGYVSFSSTYEADIVNEKEITVTQYLSIINRSGIDIKADTAMFYYRSSHQYIHPIHFNPWIVRKYIPAPTRTYKKTKNREIHVDMAMMNEEMGGTNVSMAMAKPIVSYEDAREYKIQNLNLPSTGTPLDVKVLTWRTDLTCNIRAYPYIKRQAFHVCSFKPKYQIDSHQWKIKSGRKMMNENAVGEYKNKNYNLYTKIEEDIQIRRKAIVKKERETGIFGGTARKKDGFVITLTNKAKKHKTLTIIERIPTSTTDEIKSKLLSIKSDKKVNYKILQDGKIEMHVKLDAHESKQIEILFELSYDKDLKVSY